ncbi:MAG: hypothetical protein K6A74_00130 [Lachnospiraceae bacterium]|nr:hypothetical protein [Lachnospiraceae bacterium]
MKKKENKIYKGDYGYIREQRKLEIIKAAIMIVLPVAIFLTGYFATGSNQNILTFVAVLGCLPMASNAIHAYLFIRAKGCSEELYKKLVGAGIASTYYDLYFTAYKRNYQVSALILKKGCLIAITEDMNMDLTEGEDHIKDVLSKCGGEKISVKFFNDADKYIERARELSALSDDNKDYSFIYENIMSVSI